MSKCVFLYVFAMQQKPVEVNHFDGQKIIAVGAGDEFSLAVDARYYPWGWGRAEHGQLGFESRSSRGGPESVKQSVFKPAMIDALTQFPDTPKQLREDSPVADAPLLDIDLEWDLPDFATIGSPHFPYGRKVIDAALDKLYGIYRTSAVVWICQDWEDWDSMATVYTKGEQWPQALECSLKSLACCGSVATTDKDSIVHIFQTYLQKLISETENYHSTEFVTKGLQMLNGLICHWETQGMELSVLEDILMKDLTILSFPLSLIIRETKRFSFGFHLKVAKEVVDQIMKGSPKPEDLVAVKSLPGPSETKPHKEVTNEGLLSDSRLWAEVMRNLSKDIHKSSSFMLTGSSLLAFNQETGASTDEMQKRNVIAFSCGHAFTETQFESHVLIEFIERVQNFPVPIPETLFQLQNCYNKLAHYPLACPHCVFQYLRQLQLQECPEIPIKPWAL
jgi:hypothetical protein